MTGVQTCALPIYVCRLRRALYGLKQAPRAWFERFSSVIRAAGFTPSEHDPALFIHTSQQGRTLLLLYVDDMLITGDDMDYVAFVKKKLGEQFMMSDLGPLSYFLGIEVHSDSDGYYLSQHRYVQDLLARSGMTDTRTAAHLVEQRHEQRKGASGRGQCGTDQVLFAGAYTGPAVNASVIDMGDRFRLLVNLVDTVEQPHPLPKSAWSPGRTQ